MPAGMANRTVLTLRRPLGVAGLIASFNTPLPNLAWKIFPALFCGNAAVFKPSEHVPASAHLFAVICDNAGLPPGVLNVVQGLGVEAGKALGRASGVRPVCVPRAPPPRPGVVRGGRGRAGEGRA